MKKKIVVLVSILMLLMATVVNAKGKKSKEEKKFEKAMQGFQLEAVINVMTLNYVEPKKLEVAIKNGVEITIFSKKQFLQWIDFFQGYSKCTCSRWRSCWKWNWYSRLFSSR